MAYITYTSFKENLLNDSLFTEYIKSLQPSVTDIQEMLQKLFNEFKLEISNDIPNTPIESPVVNYKLLQDMINQQLVLSKVNSTIDTTQHKKTTDIYNNNESYVVSIDKTLIYRYSNGRLIEVRKSIFNPTSKYFTGLFIKNNI